MAYTYSDSSSKGSKHEAQVNYDNLLELGETYKLGEYTFTVTARTIPQTGLIDVIARATGPQGKVGAKTLQVPEGSEFKGWYLEANDTTADIYVLMEVPIEGSTTKKGSSLDLGPYTSPIEFNNGGEMWWPPESGGYERLYFDCSVFAYRYNYGILAVPDSQDITFLEKVPWAGVEHTVTVSNPNLRTVNGKTVKWFNYVNNNNVGWHDMAVCPNDGGFYDGNMANVAWTMIYGTPVDPEYEEQENLIGRFAITAQEAGATAGTDGEENGWEDVDDGQVPLYPGDEGYPDPEDPDYPGDDTPYFPPSKTLTVTINGALSGRHNDPLNDTSYSYVPSDQIAQTQYGSGGIGGNGGGGGAGASTIIVRKFATKKADSKTFVLKPKRHGYGSGGGKGGGGGDGCILIYY